MTDVANALRGLPLAALSRPGFEGRVGLWAEAQPHAACVRTVAPPDGEGVLLLVERVLPPTPSFAHLAHAIRNPLSTILCLAGIMPSEAVPEGDESLHDRLVAEADRLAALADDIAAVARPWVPRLRAVDLVAEVEGMQAALTVEDARVEAAVPVAISVGEALRAAPGCTTDPEIFQALVVRLARRARMSFEDVPVEVRLDRSEAGLLLRVRGGALLPGRGASVALATVATAALALGGSVETEADASQVCVALPQPSGAG